MLKCAVRVDGVVFQLLGSYCGQSNPSPAKRRFANDEGKVFQRYLLSNKYTWWNKFTSEKIAFDIDCRLSYCSPIKLKALLALLSSNIRTFQWSDIQGNRIHYKSEEYRGYCLSNSAVQFSHFRLSANLNWSILVCSCQKRENSTNPSKKKMKHPVQRKSHY